MLVFNQRAGKAHIPVSNLVSVRKAARLAVYVAEMIITAKYQTLYTILPDNHVGASSAP